MTKVNRWRRIPGLLDVAIGDGALQLERDQGGVILVPYSAITHMEIRPFSSGTSELVFLLLYGMKVWSVICESQESAEEAADIISERSRKAPYRPLRRGPLPKDRR